MENQQTVIIDPFKFIPTEGRFITIEVRKNFDCDSHNDFANALAELMPIGGSAEYRITGNGRCPTIIMTVTMSAVELLKYAHKKAKVDYQESSANKDIAYTFLVHSLSKWLRNSWYMSSELIFIQRDLTLAELLQIANIQPLIEGQNTKHFEQRIKFLEITNPEKYVLSKLTLAKQSPSSVLPQLAYRGKEVFNEYHSLVMQMISVSAPSYEAIAKPFKDAIAAVDNKTNIILVYEPNG